MTTDGEQEWHDFRYSLRFGLQQDQWPIQNHQSGGFVLPVCHLPVCPLTLTYLTCVNVTSPVCSPPPPSLWCTEDYNNQAGLTWRWDMPPQHGLGEWGWNLWHTFRFGISGVFQKGSSGREDDMKRLWGGFNQQKKKSLTLYLPRIRFKKLNQLLFAVLLHVVGAQVLLSANCPGPHQNRDNWNKGSLLTRESVIECLDEGAN